MGVLSTWEALLMGAILLVVLFWFRPGIKAMLVESRHAQKDWRGFLIPIAFVVLFVLLMIKMT